ncbi:MAG TPA: hypothetical protein VFK13_13515 [Gemmatimonadaceae bacterium]|nr:hypothetical protein [Gemmatimonadaceae bacterium]
MTTFRRQVATALRSAGWRAGALGALAVISMTACSLDVTDPDIVQPGQVNSDEALPTLVAGAFGDFAFSFAGDDGGTEGIILAGGLRADEWVNSDTFDTRQEIDRGAIFEDNGSNQDIFRNLQQARVSAEFAAEQFDARDPGGDGHSAVLSLAGFAYILTGETYCPGVAFSRVSPDGTIQFGQPNDLDAVFQFAADRFTSALDVATSDDEANLARVGLGRALLDQGHFDEAAAAVASVPTNFVFNVEYSDNTSRESNGVFVFNQISRRWSASDLEGGNGLPFRSDADPRVVIDPLLDGDGDQRVGVDAVTPMWVQRKYQDRNAAIPLATGVEARLIEAEAQLQALDNSGFLETLNDLRSNPDVSPGGLSDLSDPGSPEGRVDLLFKERAYWMYLTAHRLGDMRRLVRQYGRAITDVFPTGDYPKGGAPYGNEVNLPIPIDERNNPNSQGCTSRAI